MQLVLKVVRTHQHINFQTIVTIHSPGNDQNVKIMPKSGKSTGYDQNSRVCQYTTKCQISSYSLHALPTKWPESPNLISSEGGQDTSVYQISRQTLPVLQKMHGNPNFDIFHRSQNSYQIRKKNRIWIHIHQHVKFEASPSMYSLQNVFSTKLCRNWSFFKWVLKNAPKPQICPGLLSQNSTEIGKINRLWPKFNQFQMSAEYHDRNMPNFNFMLFFKYVLQKMSENPKFDPFY